MLDVAPKVLTEKTNAAAKAAVDSALALAKDVVVGREARAQIAQGIQLGIRLGGWIGSRLGIPTGVVGAQIGFVEGSDGVTRNPAGSKICFNGKDPSKCDELYKAYQQAKKRST